MRKTCLLLLFFHLLVGKAFCQINLPDSSVQTIGYWDLREVQHFEIVLKNFEVSGGDTLNPSTTKYFVDMEILDSTASSYQVRWTYRDMTYEAPEVDSVMSRIVRSMMEISGGSVVEFETDEYGAFKSVTNWKEIRDYYKVVSDSLQKTFEGIPQVQSMMENFMKIYQSKESIESSSVKDIIQFLNYHGGQYRLNENLFGKLKFPGVLPNTTIDASVMVVLKEFYPEDDEYLIYSFIEHDPEQLKEQAKMVVKRLLPTLTSEELEASMEQVGELWNTIENYTIVHDWGWPIYSTQTQQTGSRQKVKFEIRTIEII